MENLTAEVLQAGVDGIRAAERAEVALATEAVTPTPPVEIPPDEDAVVKFTRLLPYIKKMGLAMPSQKGIVRVLHALAEFPLGEAQPRLLTDGERQLFQIFMEIMKHKSVVVESIMKKNIAAKAAESVDNNVSTNEN